MSRWSEQFKKTMATQQQRVDEMMGIERPCETEPEEEMLIIVELEEPARGVCKKCNKHIGRGVRFHERGCRGQ